MQVWFLNNIIQHQDGICKEDKFSIDQPIGPVPYDAITTTGSIFAASKDGKFALSHCEVLKRNKEKNETLLKVNIVTGRPHQVRICIPPTFRFEYIWHFMDILLLVTLFMVLEAHRRKDLEI